MPALFLLAGGCATIPDSAVEIPTNAAAVELDETPFFPQERYQCGPAALTTVLTTSGVDVALEDIVNKVYLPGRKGSLQSELMAATRTEGRLPYVIDGTLAAILRELEVGRPVLVLQNLGVAAIPRWHYAVVVGMNPERGEVILRSGTDGRRVTASKTFVRTWQRGDYWAMVALRPDEIPVSADRERYFTAIAALEQTGQLETAAMAWRAAEQAWPGDVVVLFGVANVHLASGDFIEAESAYRTVLAQDESLLVARNNLALALAEQGEFDAAIEEIGIALARNHDPALEPELRDTEMTIQSMLESNE